MNKVIIAPKNYHDYLRKHYRDNDIFTDVKLITIEQLCDKFFGRVDEEFAFTLFNDFDIEYSRAKKIIKYLPRLFDHEKYKNYFSLCLERGLLEKDEYLSSFLKGEVIVYQYKRDNRLLNFILDYLHIERIYKDIDIFNIKHPLYILNTISDEVKFLFIKIQSLLNEGVKPEDIFIYGVNEDNKLCLSKYCKDYGIVLNNLNIQSLYKSELFKIFLSFCEEEKDIVKAIETFKQKFIFDEMGESIIDAILPFIKDNLSYDKQIEVLLNESRNIYLDNEKYSNAINILNDANILEDKHIFVLDFNCASFPSSTLDNDVISDKEKENHNIFTSLEVNKLEKDKLISFFKTNNKFYFYFGKKHMSNIHYLSFLKDDLILDVKEINYFNEDYSYSNALLTFAKLKDILYKYNESHPLLASYSDMDNNTYRTYDNSFKKFYVLNEDSILHLSFSKFSSYDSCPFHYYLKFILGVKDVADEQFIDIGTVVHSVYEKAFANPNKFDEIYDTEVSNKNFQDKQLVFMSNLKETLKITFVNTYNHYKNMSNPALYLEQKVSFNIDNKTLFNGVIDKAIATDNKNLFLFDYKTGKKTLSFKNIQERNNLQLAFYALLAKKDSSFASYDICGLYYLNVLPSNINEIDQTGVLSYSKAEGLTIKNIEVIQTIEPNFLSDDIIYTKLKPLTKKGEFPENNCYIEEINVKEIVDIALEELEKFNKNLRDNMFPISPKVSGSTIACKYCSNKDICFRRNERREDNLEEDEDGLV